MGLAAARCDYCDVPSLLTGGCWRWPAVVVGAGAVAGVVAGAGYWMLSDVGIYATVGAVVEQGWRVRCCNFALQQRHAEC